MSYQLGAFGFVRWEGPRPGFVRQKVVEFAKPGANGISAQLQGVKGEQFATALTAVFANETDTRLAESTYRNLIGTTVVLVYEGTNYSTTYSHDYLVHDVMVQSAKKRPLLVGPSYNYPSGWELISRWELIPIATS